tara:strand:+ start:644 stop:841 length:198 start_codon:yes stop_codon:yes gene_type:complete
MNHTLNYEPLDKHWIVTLESNHPKGNTVMRFPTKQQAIAYIDIRLKTYIQKEIKEISETEDNPEK